MGPSLTLVYIYLYIYRLHSYNLIKLIFLIRHINATVLSTFCIYDEFPDFYNWNRVKVRYCDGSSFTGDVEAVNPVSHS